MNEDTKRILCVFCYALIFYGIYLLFFRHCAGVSGYVYTSCDFGENHKADGMVMIAVGCLAVYLIKSDKI